MGHRSRVLEELVMPEPYLDFYSGKVVFVTGNTGFKGAWLSYWLNLLGAKVVGYAKDIPTTPSFFDALGVESNQKKQYWADVRNYLDLHSAISESQPDVVFHLAAQPIVRTSIEDPIETFQTNAMGTVHILNALREQKHQIPSVIITSDKCYENNEWLWGYRESDKLGGCDPYSASKAVAEIAFSSMTRTYSQLLSATGRAGNVIGGGDWAANRIVPDAIRSWTLQETLNIRAPNATRPWQHVLEPLSGYLKLGYQLHCRNADVIGQSFNFGPDDSTSYSVKYLLDEMLKRWPQKNCDYHVDDDSGVEAGLLKLNCDKSAALLGWQQKLSIQQTIDYTVKWYWQNANSTDLNEITKQQIVDFMELV